MGEYIKREDALAAVLFALVGTGYQSRATDAIRYIPTTDVAPRAEVAREIFEEMDRILLPLLHEVSQVYIYVKLKRKYTEAEPLEGE